MKPIKKTYLVTVRYRTERTKISERELCAMIRRDPPYRHIVAGDYLIKSGKVVAIEEE